MSALPQRVLPFGALLCARGDRSFSPAIFEPITRSPGPASFPLGPQAERSGDVTSDGRGTVRALCRTIAIAAAIGLGLNVHFASAQVSVTCGQLVNGAIDAPAEQDVFTFAAEAGDIVTITLAQTAAVDPAFAAFGHLFGPTGTGPTPIGRGIVNVPITQTGTHTLRIFDLFNTSRGGYSVRAHWLFPLAKQCGDRVTLSCGQLSAGAINTPLEQDVFRFAAEAGDIVTITLAQTAAVDPAFAAFGHLFGPTGAGPTPIGRGIVNVPITQTGTHTLRIFDLFNTARGGYSVRVHWLLPLAKQCGDRVTLGCGQLSAGAIDTPLEQDVFTFAAEAGDTVTITLAQTAAVDPTFAAFGHLFGPTGAGPTPIGRGIVNVPITQTGTHTLRIFDLFNTARGAYSVRLLWLLPLAKQCAGTTLALDKTSLRFGAVTNGTAFQWQTAAQVVRLTQSGTGTVTWTATANQPWLQVNPPSGSGSANLSISVVSVGGLPVGSTVAGTITLTVTGASNIPGPISVALNLIQLGTEASPFGSVDTPLNNIVGVTGAIPFTGWALDDVEVTRVMLCRAAFGAEVAPFEPNCGGAAQIFVGFAVFIDGARPDVQAAFPTYPVNTRAGWGFMVLTNMLPNQGNGTYLFYMHAQDREGHTTLLGTRTMTCANASATKPFGAIDTPTQGGVASGSSFVNFGWALTPQPKLIPIDGSTITVLIDGTAIGTVDYNHERPDIETLFPSFQNTAGTNGAVGFRVIDTTTLTNGLHTISWTVVDNAGTVEGIGSRFFIVTNGTGAPMTAAADAPASSRGTATAEDFAATPRDDSPVLGRRGWDLEGRWRWYTTGRAGRVVIRGEEIDRFELALGEYADARYTGHLRVGDGLAPLPVGSQLDRATGQFTWAPGVGFVGTYDFMFVQHVGGQTAVRREVRIIVQPKGSQLVGPQVVIDTPRSQQVMGQPFMLAGWAADLSATQGTGIATLHAWAHPLGGGPPVFLGATAYGGARPDVAEVYGEQFVNSGFGLAVQGLAHGNYDLAVYAWSETAADFVPARTVRVTMR